LIEAAHPQISIARQCDLVGLPRSTYYYHTQGESAENLTLMRLLDQQYTDTPYYGIRRMTAWLRSQGYAVNHKRVARLLRTMGLEALYPKPRMSEPHPTHRVYPYLLRGMPITRVNQVWSTDITYTPLLYFSEYQVNYHLAMAVCCLANKVAKRSTACCPR
jgi:putative transposase